jgi:endo-1,4-beta-xylanase
MKSRRPLPVFMTVAGLVAALLTTPVLVTSAHAAVPEVVLTNDFEDGTAQSWYARGGSVSVSAAAAHGGTSSLLNVDRTATWNGPGRDMRGVLLSGATYAVEAYVRLAAGTTGPVAVHLTMERTPEGGTASYSRVGSAGAVTDAEWAVIRGEYTYTGEVSTLQLYFESPDATASFHVDDIKVTMTAAPPTGPPDEAGIACDFESGTAQGWTARIGRETLTVTTADAHSGTASLLTSGRAATFDGPSLNVLGRFGKGKTYDIAVWVKLAPGEAATQLRLSLERRTAGTPSYETLAGPVDVTADGWVKLAAKYTLAHDVDFLSTYVESDSATASYYIDDFTAVYQRPLPIQTDIPALKDVLPFTIGTAMDRTETVGVLSELVLRHYESVTPGNALKWDSTEPREGEFNWAEADAQVNFGISNGLSVRGHTLVWHSQTPAWVFQNAAGQPLTNSPEDKALLLTRLENHIRAEIGHFGDRIKVWDVANEVIDENQPDGLRRSRWFEVTGLDYLRTAFRVAREVAPPGTKLVINDYNTETPRKRGALANLVRQLRAEGVPIDTVGHQMHINVVRPPISDIEATLDTFAALGVDQQVTELDISAYTNFTDTAPISESTIVAQGYRYRDVFDALRRHAGQLSSVTLWGASDANTWLTNFPIPRPDQPLLFDGRLQAKPAYWGVVDPSKLPPLIRTATAPEARPAVDGKRDPVWDLQPDVWIASNGTLAARFQVRWHGNQAYAMVEVVDATRNRYDLVEVVVGGASRTAARWQGRPTADGYRVEVAVPLPATGAAGTTVPFDVRLTDDATGSKLAWNGSPLGQVTLLPPVAAASAVRGTPVLDGTAEKLWSRAPAISTTVPLQGTGGATGTARLLWDDTHLYVFVKVTDPTLDESNTNAWEQDSVELFVDPDNSKSVGYDDDDGQYRVSFTNRQTISGTFGGFAIADNLRSAARIVPGGYEIEASIELDTIDPRVGSLLGFELQVNDATGGRRTAAAGWHDPTGSAFNTTTRWGVVRLC